MILVLILVKPFSDNLHKYSTRNRMKSKMQRARPQTSKDKNFHFRVGSHDTEVMEKGNFNFVCPALLSLFKNCTEKQHIPC